MRPEKRPGEQPAAAADVGARVQRAGRPLPFAYKLTLAITALVVVGMALLGMAAVNNLVQVLDEQTELLGETLAKEAAEAAKEYLLADDLLGLNTLVGNLTRQTTVVGAVVYSRSGEAVASAGLVPTQTPGTESPSPDELGTARAFSWKSPGTVTTPVRSFVAPVWFQDLLVGEAMVTLNRRTAKNAENEAIYTLAAATALLATLAAVAVFMLGRQISRPIDHLVEASRAFDAGDYDYRIRERRHDEIGKLFASFNTMAEGLLQKNQVEQALSRFVSPAVASQLMANLGQVELEGRYVTASVMFTDMVGFTSLSERVSPQELAQTLNEYLPYINRASRLCHGTVDKYTGDGAMVLFGVPEIDEDHCYNAVCCALLFRRAVEHLNEQRAVSRKEPIRFRFGLNCGEMLAGTMGSEERMQYTVVGDTVNLAARLCGAADLNQIVVGADFLDQPMLQQRVISRPHKSIFLRGKAHPVETYIIEGLAAPWHELLEYRARELLEAPEQT